MKTLLITHSKLFIAFSITAVLVLSGQNSHAQLKVGENPSSIHPASVLEVESPNKGLLLPRVTLTSTTVWGLAGTPVAGMQVYNTNIAVAEGVAFYPPAPGGKGVYTWDGDGWVPSKSAGSGGSSDFDWLKISGNGSPSTPGDITSGIYHGGAGNQEVMVRTNETGASNFAQFSVRAAHESAMPIAGNFFASTLGGGVVGLKAESNHAFQIQFPIGLPALHIDPNFKIGLFTTSPSFNHGITVENSFLQRSGSSDLEAEASVVLKNGIVRLFHKNNALGEPSIEFGHVFDSNSDSDASIRHAGSNLNGRLLMILKSVNNNKIPFTALNSNGFVGINDDNPIYQLSVNGDINASGEVRNSGVALTSDARLKRNIHALENGLGIVSKLNPVSYEKKATIADSVYNKSEIGFIAQEVQKILPQLIREGKDADKTLALDYNSLIPVLTRAIQEQQKQIEMLTAERDVQAAQLNKQSAELNTQSDKLNAQLTRLDVQSTKLEAQAAELAEIKKLLNVNSKGSTSSVSK
ncbi:tail fiber domain-containing protein [Dyadobacter sp. CY347]|uniref:tail fiber domain-containing protein n=1 Tax=Dyadobacter sp. CY347 TaxID=2909336 RepID=UPI001F230B45|nr:tail fiber domain-containing protein [Dyadobacter sp. CY347]MCF2491457.1 tail fiber domain-containing protein [Dyadobacter sp. CY347]